MTAPPATLRAFVDTPFLAVPAIVGLDPLVRPHAANEGQPGVALRALVGVPKPSIAPELPLAKLVGAKPGGIRVEVRA
jgi:hypothetical protein